MGIPSIVSLYRKWFYVRNHARILVRHLTVRRALNLVINQCEYLLRRQALISFPGFMKIDPSNRCQLRCRGCGQSSGKFRRSLPEKSFLTLNEFKQILGPLASTTLGVSLSALGEPLLNREVVAMVKYSNGLNIGVTISTNLSLDLGDEYLEALVGSGLDKLIVALDGIDKETYEKYRVNGKYELVTENVRRLAEIKRKYCSNTPELQWKFIVFDHNIGQMSQVPILYKQLGFDSYRIDFNRDNAGIVEKAKSRFSKKRSCFWLYSTIRVDVDGSVYPCCSYTGLADWQIGNALMSDARLLWNGPSYIGLRRGFGRSDYGRFMHPTCQVCFGGKAPEVSRSED